MARRTTLAARVAELATALDAAEGRLPTEVTDRAREVLERANQRSQLSAEHTVVALAGATGAGKSAVFNALAGSELARTGRQRPTTSRAMAAVAESAELGGGAAALLDWLEVPTRHDLDPTAHPDGLILLDLPDDDSVVAEHRARSDFITARADLLIWVTNPQKYADAVLHARNLRDRAASSGVVLVVLNQIDRLTPAQADECLADLRRLVDRDGVDAQVLATSAHTGQGIDRLRDLVAEAVARRQAATQRLGAHVRDAARSLLAQVPDRGEQAHDLDASRSRMIAALEEAAGVPLVVSAVEAAMRRDAAAATGWPPTRWVQRFRSDPLRTLGLRSPTQPTTSDEPSVRRSSLPQASPALRARVSIATREHVSLACAALPGPWGDRVRADVLDRAATVSDALDAAIVPAVAVPRPRWWRVVSTVQWALLAAMLGGVAWLGVLAGLDYAQLPTLATPEVTVGAWTIPWPTALAIGGAVLGILLAVLSRILARFGARRLARRTRRMLRHRVRQVARTELLGQIDAEIDALATIRGAAARAAH